MPLFSIATVLMALAAAPQTEAPSEAPQPLTQAQRAVERGLLFVEKDVVKWRKEKGCATCHHGTMTVWALSEAKSQGYTVAPETLADVVKWTKERILKDLDKPRDKRPGWNMVNTPAVYLAVMAQAVPNQDAVTADELKGIAGQLVRHQETDGSWAWSIAPAANRFPPVFESDEVVTLLAYMTLGPHVPADPKEKSTARESREKAAAWLRKAKPTDTTQAAALRLLVKIRAGETAKALQKEIDQFLSLQNKDGGWGQLKDLPSDAYATGQALYVLNQAGVKNDLGEVRRGVAFLVATQREDGSWPMTPRAQPGAKPATNRVPITYFGSAWATLALVRSVPPARDLAATRRRALEEIRMLDGKVEVDENQPGKPVVRVFFQGYEINDIDLEKVTKLLAAFPQMTTLRLKSPRITDAGLESLKRLPQLQSLALEDASITDAGLGHLKALTQIQKLYLKGTKVTDAGVQEFQKAIPKVKVER